MCRLLLDVSESEDQGCHFGQHADLGLFLRKSELTECTIEAMSRLKLLFWWVQLSSCPGLPQSVSLLKRSNNSERLTTMLVTYSGLR